MEEKDILLMNIGKMMHVLFRVFRKRMELQTIEDIKLSTEQFGLLHAISKMDEDCIQKDMADMLGKDKSAILRMIDSLEEKELVRRVVDQKDRRKNYLMVTKTGERVIKQYMKIVKETIDEIQVGLTQSDLKTFQKVIMHIKSNAEKL